MIRNLQNINYWKETIKENEDFSVKLLSKDFVKGNKFLASLVNASENAELLCVEILINNKNEVVSYFKGVFKKDILNVKLIKSDNIINIFDFIASVSVKANVILSMVYLDDTEEKYFNMRSGDKMLMLNSKYYTNEGIFGNLQEITRVDSFEFFEGGRLEELLTS